jgi:tetratricopeptide (TPR) repeat protein
MSPAVKLGWGVVLGIFGLLLLVPFLPLGLPLLGGGVWLAMVGFTQRNQPKWQIRVLIRKAAKQPAKRAELLGQALKIDPENPEALAACAENAFQTEDWSSANQLFERYLVKAPADSQAQLHLGFSYMNAGDTDKALQRLEPIRAGFGAESPAGLTNAVAIGFLKKGEPGQALEILKILPLRKQILDTALQQSLFLRALAHYQSHQKAAALSDFDRLYALKPDYPNLEPVRDAVKAGTFDLNSIQFSVGQA